MSIVQSFSRLCCSVFFLRVYPVLPHNRENILFSFRLNPCVFALAVELGTGSGSEGGRREGDRKGTRRGESNNRGAWNLVMYTSPLVPWLIPVTGLLSKKRKKGTPAAQRRCLWLPIPPRRPFLPRSSRLHYHILPTVQGAWP